jgi:hypothetical protein
VLFAPCCLHSTSTELQLVSVYIRFRLCKLAADSPLLLCSHGTSAELELVWACGSRNNTLCLLLTLRCCCNFFRLQGTSAELELVSSQWEAVRTCPDR